MADGQLNTVIGQLRRLMGEQSGCTLADGQLLANFVNKKDEAAFEVMVWRHGTMVFNLCKRVLRDSHEAEDAFQATFLVFARKAGSIGKAESVGGWLYKVAYRVALRIRAKAAKRANGEDPVDELPAPDNADDLIWRDLRPVLDEEINRLPEKYRQPFVLCYLEGHTNEEAAQQLGCPKGTILSRLSRGRERLRSRLALRGLGLSAGWLTTMLLPKSASAAVPTALVGCTVEGALPFAAGKATTGLVSTVVVSLSQSILRSMLLTKIKIAAAMLLTLGILGVGAEAITNQVPPGQQVAERRDTDDKAALRKEEDRVSRGQERNSPIVGNVVEIDEKGKSFSLAIPPALRGGEPKKMTFTLGEKTLVTYSGVGPDGAKLTRGYRAEVRLAEDARDAVASVAFAGEGRGIPPPDIAGKILAVARNGRTLTIGMPTRGERAKTFELAISEKTRFVYSGVGTGAAHLNEGLNVQVWLTDGIRGSTAGTVQVNGQERAGSRSKAPDISGTVAAVPRSGNSIAVETLAGRGRGEAGKRLEIKLSEKAVVCYHHVGPNGASPTKGYRVDIWLEEGSNDTAGMAAFTGPESERQGLIEGTVVAVSTDGAQITLQRPGASRGSSERMDMRITERTRITYFGVGPGGARLTEGYQAQVRLEEGTRDAALMLLRTQGPGGRR